MDDLKNECENYLTTAFLAAVASGNEVPHVDGAVKRLVHIHVSGTSPLILTVTSSLLVVSFWIQALEQGLRGGRLACQRNAIPTPTV
jgi:hypothetical protein